MRGAEAIGPMRARGRSPRRGARRQASLVLVDVADAIALVPERPVYPPATVFTVALSRRRCPPEHRVGNGIAGEVADADRLTHGVDRRGAADAAAEGAEVNHPACLRPGERTGLGIAGESAAADYLAAGVHRNGDAVGAAEGAEVDHPARLCPREGIGDHIASQGAAADHLAAGVQSIGVGAVAAEGAEVDHPARLCPGERMALTVSGAAVADYLAA